MKRKINRVGQNTFTVSLPTKWAQKHHLKAGDELEYYENGKDIIFSSDLVQEKKEISVDISHLGEMTGRFVGALYKAGYDCVRINYDDPKKLQIVEKELAKGFIGFDIIHHDTEHCIIENMATLNHDELQNSIRRVFRLFIQSADELLEAGKKKDYNEITAIAYRDRNINKFSDFGRRLLNKLGHPEAQKTSVTYFVLEELENIGDKLRDLCKFIVAHKLSFSPAYVKLYLGMQKLFDAYYQLYFDFKEDKCVYLKTCYNEIMSDIAKAYSSKLSWQENVLIARLEGMVQSIFDLNGPLLTLYVVSIEAKKKRA